MSSEREHLLGPFISPAGLAYIFLDLWGINVCRLFLFQFILQDIHDVPIQPGKYVHIWKR